MSTVDHKAGPRVRVISYSREPFLDRFRAGMLLAEELKDLRGQKTTVLGIPRGGIVVAQALAQVIGAALDIILARKLGAPGHSELAMGALAESGEVILNQDIVEELHIPET
jgi:putative phosphoribosyl transferase